MSCEVMRYNYTLAIYCCVTATRNSSTSHKLSGQRLFTIVCIPCNMQQSHFVPQLMHAWSRSNWDKLVQSGGIHTCCCFVHRIFQFENFSRTKKRVLSQEDNEAALVSG